MQGGDDSLTPRFRRVGPTSQVGSAPHVRSEFRGLHRFRRVSAISEGILGALTLVSFDANLRIALTGRPERRQQADPSPGWGRLRSPGWGWVAVVVVSRVYGGS